MTASPFETVTKTLRERWGDDIRAWEVQLDDGAVAVLSGPSRARALREQLTVAERDIVDGIVRGESNRSIALRRGTSIRTVANQVATVFQKLRVMSRGELVVLVRQLG